MPTTQKSAKTFAIEAIMRSPKMQRDLAEALKAPPGSTKRMYAKSLLSSVKKVASNRFDGQGGPGIVKPKSPWDRFKPLPAPRQASQQDGQGGALAYGPRATDWSSYRNRLSSGESWGTVWNDAKNATSAPNELIDQELNSSFWSKPGAFQSTHSNDTIKSGGTPGALSKVGGAVLGFAQKAPIVGANLALDAGALAGSTLKYGAATANAVYGVDEAMKNRAKNYLLGWDTEKRTEDWTQTPHGKAASAIANYPTAAEQRLAERYPWLIGSKGTPGGFSTVANAAVPGQAGASGVSTQQNINSLYQKYFGRNASSAEVANWSKEAPDSLEKFLQNEQTKYGVKPGSQTQNAGNQNGGANGNTSGSVSGSYSESNSVYGPQSPGSSGVSGSSGSSSQNGGNSQNGGSVYGSSGLKGWDALRGAVQNGFSQNLGPEATFEMIMSDPQTQAQLKELFPGVPEWALPKGASLANQLNDLKELKRKEMGLDEMLERRKSLTTRGATLKDDLVDYVRGKDEYATHIDKLLNDAESKMMARSDFADPRVQQANNQYVQYLTVLKGRQNKRYTDVLNDSINQHNQELEQLNNTYNDTLQQFNDEMASGAAITQEVYTKMYNSLTGLYNGLASASGSSVDDEIKWVELEMKKTQLANLQNGIDANGAKTKTGDYQAGWTMANGAIDPNLTSKIDLTGLLATAAENQLDYNAASGIMMNAMTRFKEGLATKPDKDVQPSQNDLQRILNVNESIMDFTNTYGGNESAAALNGIVAAAIPDIMSKEKDLLAKFLTANKDAVRKSLNNLKGGTTGIIFKDTVAPMGKAEWEAANAKLGLPPQLNDMIWAAYQNQAIQSLNIWSAADGDMERKLAAAAVSGIFGGNFADYLPTQYNQ